jgi:hypothetical protein
VLLTPEERDRSNEMGLRERERETDRQREVYECSPVRSEEATL